MEGEDLATATKPPIWLRATKPQDLILQKQEEASLQAHTKPMPNSELPAEGERKGKECRRKVYKLHDATASLSDCVIFLLLLTYEVELKQCSKCSLEVWVSDHIMYL